MVCEWLRDVAAFDFVFLVLRLRSLLTAGSGVFVFKAARVESRVIVDVSICTGPLRSRMEAGTCVLGPT